MRQKFICSLGLVAILITPAMLDGTVWAASLEEIAAQAWSATELSTCANAYGELVAAAEGKPQLQARTVDLLIDHLRRHAKELCRAWAGLKLGEAFKVPEAAVDPLLSAMAKEPSHFVRAEAASGLGYAARPSNRILDGLLAAFSDSNDSVRSRVVGSLGRLASEGVRSPGVFEILVRATKDTDGFVRQRSASALAELKDRRAVDPIRALLQDPKDDVRKSAMEALQRLGLSEPEIKEAGLSPREALERLVKEVADSSAFEPEKREKILQMVRTLNPPPAIPGEAERHMARGQAAVKVAKSLKDYRTAEEEFQKAADLAPWWSAPYYNLGIVLEKQRAYDRAIRGFEFYLKAEPSAPDAKEVQAKIYEIQFMQERITKASALFAEGADLWENKGRKEEGLALFRKALDLDPASYDIQRALGIAMHVTGRYKDAIVHLVEAKRIQRMDLNTYWTLAEAYEKLGSADDAIGAYEEGLREYGLLADTKLEASMRKNLGGLYYRKGNRAKAIENYEIAIKKKHPDSNTIQGWINQMR